MPMISPYDDPPFRSTWLGVGPETCAKQPPRFSGAARTSFKDAARLLLAPVAAAYRGATVLDHSYAPRPVYRVSLADWPSAQKAVDLLGDLLANVSVSEGDACWVVKGDVVGEWA